MVIDIDGSVEGGSRRRVTKPRSQKVRSILNESDSSGREESVAETRTTMTESANFRSRKTFSKRRSCQLFIC